MIPGRRKPAPVPLHPNQIPNGLHCEWPCASVVRREYVTAWAMAYLTAAYYTIGNTVYSGSIAYYTTDLLDFVSAVCTAVCRGSTHRSMRHRRHKKQDIITKWPSKYTKPSTKASQRWRDNIIIHTVAFYYFNTNFDEFLRILYSVFLYIL